MPGNVKALVVMGVSGSGKSTVGQALAERLGWRFYDGDDYHPQANIDKMAAGVPLNDEDRQPWLEKLRSLIEEKLAHDRGVVVACSALKQRYRDILLSDNDSIGLVYLRGDYATIEQRMGARRGHFMKAGMLASQFEALEEPQQAITVEIAKPVVEMVDVILLQV